MPKVLVLYHSAYGHIETMAKAVAEGAREAGAQVDIKRVPETVPLEIAQGAHFKLDQEAPIATVAVTGKRAVIMSMTDSLVWKLKPRHGAAQETAEAPSP